MKKLTLTSKTYRVSAIIVALAFSVANVTAQNGASRSLEGVWEVKTTPRNCTTNDPIPAAAFEVLYTFHMDGKMTATVPTGTPLPFHGLWRREHGWSDYSFKQTRFLRSATGTFSGKQVMGGTLTLSESGEEYTSNEYMIVFSVDGIPATPTCINSVGKRFRLEP